MNMNLLTVVTPPSSYHGCSNQKALWDRKFTPVNMKYFGHHNVRKHMESKNGEKYIILEVSL